MTPPRPASPCNTPRSPLHLAADNDHTDAITRIASTASLSALEEKDSDGKTPLHVALAFSGGAAAARALLLAGSPTEVTDDLGQTPLHIACQMNRTAAVRMLLLAGADVVRDEGVDSPQRPPLLSQPSS